MFICFYSLATASTSLNLLAIALPIAILLSALAGYLLGLLTMWCCWKRSALRQSADLAVSPAYEEVMSGRRGIELTANEAYGQHS